MLALRILKEEVGHGLALRLDYEGRHRAGRHRARDLINLRALVFDGCFRNAWGHDLRIAFLARHNVNGRHTGEKPGDHAKNLDAAENGRCADHMVNLSDAGLPVMTNRMWGGRFAAQPGEIMEEI